MIVKIKIIKKRQKKKSNDNKNEFGYYNLNNYIHNIKILKKYYNIDTITEDGNCLFYSLSKIIFNNMNYYAHIRQFICDYYKTKDILNALFEKE